MKNKSILKTITIILLAIFSIINFNTYGNPEIFPGYYTGLILALIGAFIIGLLSTKYKGAIIGGFVLGLGYLYRIHFPRIPSFDDLTEAEIIQMAQPFTDLLNKYWILLIFLGILAGFLGGKISEIIREDKSSKFSTTKIAYMAIFISLSVMINSLRIGSVSFGGFPIILSGYLMGPLSGFIVGGVADLLGFIIRPSAFAFNPLFTLTSALTGALPIIFTKLLGDKYPEFKLWKIIIGVFLGQMITSVILVPIFSVWLYGSNTLYILMARAFFKQIVSIPIYAVLIKILNDRFKKVIDFNKIL